MIRNLSALFASASVLALAAPAFAQSTPQFTAAQADAGADAYAVNCAVCHGAEAGGGPFGPALKGNAFLAVWGGAPMADLFTYVRNSMPPTAAGSLDDETYTVLLAFVMRENGVAPAESALPADVTQWADLRVPVSGPVDPDLPPAFRGIGGMSANATLPDWPAPVDRFADYTPVTQAMLSDPAPENWLAWRRGHDAQGYSPLAQITTRNVDGLTIAWSMPLPAGANMNEPLVRDGVLYVSAFGDEVFAFDAATGRMLWRYQRHLPEGATRASHKNMALYGDKLYVATSDVHLVALDARTGRPVWDRPVAPDDRGGGRIPGGPLAADGVVMQGIATQAGRGGLIAGFDAETGERLWVFNTVAQPDEPGGDTWNNLAAEDRSGGSAWTSGSYDADTGLVYWGSGPTYDTGPLRDPVEGARNDALYTNATVALDPHTGDLVWHFQHIRNDQWDLDWAFERTLADLRIDGRARRVVMNAGKPGIFDVLDAATGEYLGSADMGMQDFVTAIDPDTGEKTLRPNVLRPGEAVITMCPNGGAGRNWIPTAFNPETSVMFAQGRDTCMDLTPTGDGTGFFTTQVNIETFIPAGHDGRYGLIQGIDMTTGDVLWETRQRAPYTSGVLATAGGVVFAGGSDGQFVAYDQQTGRVLWRTGVTDTPNAAPISYAVDGRQYVALVTGHGNPLAGGGGQLTPELVTPAVNSSAITVFALRQPE